MYSVLTSTASMQEFLSIFVNMCLNLKVWVLIEYKEYLPPITSVSTGEPYWFCHEVPDKCEQSANVTVPQ